MSTDRTYWFGGGLGDVIIAIYRRTGFEELLREQDAWVAHAFGNPHTLELFRWLPNASCMRLIDTESLRLKWINEGVKGSQAERLVAWAGRPSESIYIGDPRPEGEIWDHRWAAPDLWRPSGRYVVIQPCAGEASRDLPVDLLRRLCRALISRGIEPVLITRNFLRIHRDRVVHAREVMPADLRRFQVSDLSVPATLALAQDADGVVGMHSALTHAGACMGKVSLAVQNQALFHLRDAGSWYFYYEAYPWVTRLPLVEGWQKGVEDWVASL